MYTQLVTSMREDKVLSRITSAQTLSPVPIDHDVSNPNVSGI